MLYAIGLEWGCWLGKLCQPHGEAVRQWFKIDGCYLALQIASNASLPGTSFIVNSSLENIVVAIYEVGC